MDKNEIVFIESWIKQELSIAKVAARKDITPADKKRAEGEASNFADKKNKKYKLDTEAQIRAANSYIHMPKNRKKYSAEDLKTIKANIVTAWKKKIDPKGPPSAAKKTEKTEPAGQLGKTGAALGDPVPAVAGAAPLEKAFIKSFPLSKVSIGPKGEVYVEGFLARTDVPDKTPGMAEQMDEALSTPHFEKMVADTLERSAGQSKFPVREMHQAIAAGRGIDFKHVEGKGYWGKVEVIDPVGKEKVEKGVLTSFSIGGHYGKTWVDGGILHYEGKPIEATLADVGMIPGTEFEFQHADGSVEMRKFANVLSEEETTMKPEPIAKLLSDMKEKPDIKKFVSQFAGLRKEEGGYGINQDYARQESWDIQTAAEVIQVATRLMSGEANEPEDAKEVADIIRAVIAFMAGETDEMESAATGEAPAVDGEGEEPGGAEGAEAEEPEDSPDEAGAEAEEAEEPEPSELEAAHEDMHEENSEEEDEHIKEIVRAVLAEMAEANKTERAGELAKVNSLVVSKVDVLEKGQKNIVANFEKTAHDLAGDIAKTIKLHTELSQSIADMQKTVEAYGPVISQYPPRNLPLSNGQNVTEKDMLKTLIANAKISPQLRQAYQTRLTELEIKDAKPLEEPPEFK
jgi:hypothetical protein